MNTATPHYRLLGDSEPDEHVLAALMHEVAVEAERKSEDARRMLKEKITLQISEALVREGY